MTTRFVITITTKPCEIPPLPRLRALLKLTGRHFAFRCISVTQHAAQDTPTTGHDTEAAPQTAATSGPQVDAQGGGGIESLERFAP